MSGANSDTGISADDNGLGRLFGVGIGPGDPSLVTMKGAACLRASSVIFGPAAKKGGESIAIRVARTAAEDAGAGPWSGRTVALHFPMTTDGPELRSSWAEAAGQIVDVLRNGEDAAFVTLGDPAVYSTFGYLAEEVTRLAPDVRIERVPGVTSFSAAAARVGATLVDGSAPLVVLPGTGADEGRLRKILEEWPDAGVVVMKAGSRLSATSEPLTAAGRAYDAVVVSRLGLEGESFSTLAEATSVANGAPEYLTLVLSPGQPGSLASGGPLSSGEWPSAERSSVERSTSESQGFTPRPGIVYFVGAGPGDPLLITVKGREVVSRAGTIVYAGSLVNPQVLAVKRPGAVVLDSAGMTLEETTAALVEGARRGEVVARVHTGDPAMYGAIQEQMAELDRAGVGYRVIPGVSSVFAAAAALGVQLTQPGGSQTVILTRAEGRTPVPSKEALSELAAHGSTMALFLSVSMIEEVVAELSAGYPPQTPVAVVAKASWPDERIVRGTLADIVEKVKGAGISKTALIMVGGFLEGAQGERSKLYDPSFAHMYRSSEGGESAPAPAAQVEDAGAAASDEDAVDDRIAVVALTAGGARAARRVCDAIAEQPGVRPVIYLPAARSGDSQLPDVLPLPGGAMEALPLLLRRHKKLVAICSLGIVVRALGPHLRGKSDDGGVVVADEGLKHFISVLGGHIGGANQLAGELAAVLEGEAVLTTSSDVQGLPALDVIARDLGLVEGRPGSLRTAMSALTDGAPVVFDVDADGATLRTARALAEAGVEVASGNGGEHLVVRVSDRTQAAGESGPWLVPQGIVVGVGCKRGTEASVIQTAVRGALATAGIDERALAALASIDIKDDEEGLIAAGRSLGVPLRVVTTEAILGLETAAGAAGLPISDSSLVRERVGVGGVSEPACLLVAAGIEFAAPAQVAGEASGGTPHPVLLLGKTIGEGVTVAIARAVPGSQLGGREVGRRGSLAIVGSGPGSLTQMTPAARDAIASADVIVGYKTYLQPLGGLLAGKVVRSSGMRKEVDRAREAVMLASEGRQVAMVSGGDPGIYGMAGPVLEVLGGEDPIDVRVLPGVTALSAAAAALGAPLMHDFCAISLSDLLTPWEVIEARLEAAGASDMVVALYNPKSQGRRTHLERAVAILLRHRDAATPVGIVRDAGRDAEDARVATLAGLPEEEVDMSTTVIIGNSRTRVVGGRMVTPRGYRIDEDPALSGATAGAERPL